jgi:hypothetical protein
MLACIATSNAVFSEDRTLSRFAFQNIYLNSQAKTLDPSRVSDCFQSQDPHQRFCFSKSKAGDVNLAVTLALVDEHINSIHVQFPRDSYQIMLDALRLKYGKESSLKDGVAIWFSHPHTSSGPLPDSIVLTRVPSNPPKPDGEYIFPGIDYSEIGYWSQWLVNSAVSEGRSTRENDAKRAANGL